MDVNMSENDKTRESLFQILWGLNHKKENLITIITYYPEYKDKYEQRLLEIKEQISEINMKLNEDEDE